MEDDPASRLMATSALENGGFVVEQAETAEKALQLIAGRAQDLILMDIQLPGMDGLDLTKLLKADPSTAKIPVIALTAYAMPLHQRAAMAAGCDGLIAKPVSPAELVAAVRAHVTEVNP